MNSKVSQEEILEMRCSMLLNQVLELQKEKEEREGSIIDETVLDEQPLSEEEYYYPQEINAVYDNYEDEDVGSEIQQEEYVGTGKKILQLIWSYKWHIIIGIIILIVLIGGILWFYIDKNLETDVAKSYIEEMVAESVSVAMEENNGTQNAIATQNIESISKQVKEDLKRSLITEGFTAEELQVISQIVDEKTNAILKEYISSESKTEVKSSELTKEQEAVLIEKIVNSIYTTISANLDEVKLSIAKLTEEFLKMQKKFEMEIMSLQEKLISIKFEIEKVENSDKNNDALDKIADLQKQLENIFKSLADTSNIDALKEALRLLDKELTNLIEVVDIESLNAAIGSFTVSIADIDKDMLNVKKSVNQIDTSMEAMEDILTSNIESVDEALKGEIKDVLSKMDKLSEDVYDKTIVDNHIQAIQNALDSISSSAGEMDANMKKKFNKAQADLAALKQETANGYYDKNTVNEKIKDINDSLSESLAQLAGKSDQNIKDAITGVENNLSDFAKNVEAEYKQAIDTEMERLRGEIQIRVDDAAAASAANSAEITGLKEENATIGGSIAQLINNFNAMEGNFTTVTTQLSALENKLQSGYYTKEQIDAAIASVQTSVQTALDAIKAENVNMGNNINANAAAIATLETSLTTLNESLNTKTASLESGLNGLGTSVSNLSDRVDDCFQSVSDGKELLADAITDKGVPASATEDFANLAGKIRMITTTSLAGDIKYTYHSHTSGCDTRCSGTVRKYNTRWHNEHKYYIYDYRCSQCSFDTEHHRTEPGDYQCEVVSKTCGKTESSIEKAEIIFR